MEGTKMQCPKCQFDNADGMNFCGKCGYKLSPSSKIAAKDLSFNEKLEKIQKYLPKGLTEKILSQRDKIEGERKLVTVMFCDMVGFTQLSEMLGPEEAYSVMDQVYEILIHLVHDHGGTVNEFTGDGIMALFGAPIALEDAPQRAIRSAYAIHREIAHFSDKIKQKKENLPTIKMRIGIHTGPVVVGALGNDLRVEFKAVGDTVNLASRMEGLAEPCSTYVTKDTFKLIEGLFEFAAMGEKKIKGKKESVSIYKFLSSKEEVYRPRLGSERMIYSEMVGRDKEFDRLQLQVMKVINGEGSVVNIIGEAGIGKSRLMAELKGCDVIKKVVFLEGRAISMGKNLSFHLIINLLKEWAQIRENDSGAASLSKLETALRRVDPEGMQEVLPFVATLMGMKLSGRYAERVKGIEGEALEKLILKNIKDFLIKATELNPLVLVAEDLHWADTSSIELMEFLFPLAETQRILFVNVFRPGYKETDNRIIKNIKERLPSYCVEVALQPLNERMSETLINNMLNIKGLQHAVIDQIIERAGGNPFFIEEVVRSFIDEGAVMVKDGVFNVNEKIDTMVIPHSISDVLMARIDRLEETTRDLVKVASVIGRNFFYRILKEVARTIEEIDSRLNYLKEIQLIRERKKKEELEYFFKHALAQEAAYDSILLQKRKKLHLKVADSIEKVFRERLHEFYGMLSYHYSNGEDLDKAEEYMLKAGQEALKSSASNEALYYYQRAMELYVKKYGDAVDPNKIAGMEENIGIAFFNKGNFVEAVNYLDRSLSSRGEKIQKNRIFLIIKLIINFLSIIRNLYLPQLRNKKIPSNLDNRIMKRDFNVALAVSHVDVQRFFIENIGIAAKCFNFDVSKSQVYFNLLSGSSALFSTTGISFNISRKILDYTRKSILDKDVKISLHFFKFIENVHNNLTGNWHGELDEDLVDYALKMGDVQPASGYLLFLGYMKMELGDIDTCIKIINMLDNIGDEYNTKHAKLDSYNLNSKLLIKRREPYNAIKYCNEGFILIDKIGWDARKIQFLGIKLRIQVMQNDLVAAKEIIDDAENLIHKLGKYAIHPFFYIDYLMGVFSYNLAGLEAAIASNDKKDISKYKATALVNGKIAAKYSKRRVANDRTEAYKFMGIYYWLIKKQKNAIRWFQNSIREGERISAKLELSRAYFEFGKRLLEQKGENKELNGKKAEEYLEKAKVMFEELDLKWDLEELERITAYE
jgi:class 3 adenylate cyclase